MKKITLIAFLRGINVGGNMLIKMADLKSIFESEGYENARSVLASGNILFDSYEADYKALEQKIEAKLKEETGLKIIVILRTRDELRSLFDLNPFKNIKAFESTRLHVTFLKDQYPPKIKFPFEPFAENFKILGIYGRELCSLVEIKKNKGTTNLMKFLEKEFGKNITTRTWNTVVKIADLLK